MKKLVNGIEIAIPEKEAQIIAEKHRKIAAEKAAHRQKTKYIRNRVRAYPEISDQLDMLWWEIEKQGSISKSGNFYKKIKQVKDKYPKPE